MSLALSAEMYRSVWRFFGTVSLANALFLLVSFLTIPATDLMAARIQTAFETGELGFDDYLPFDSHRGWHQYNDCNVLQLLSNPDHSRLKRVVAPIIYKIDEDFNQACPVLHRLVMEKAERDDLLYFRYGRYWHGYNVPTAIALRVMDLKQLRVLLSGTSWIAVGVLAFAALRAGRYTRWTGLAITLTASLFWAIPYFAPGLTHGPGDIFLLLAIAGIAVKPQAGTQIPYLVPYAAGFGTVVVFFEMLTGQLPTAAAWFTAMVLASIRDSDGTGTSAVRRLLVAAVTFGLAALTTILIKQLLAFSLAEPDTGSQFVVQLQHYRGVPVSGGTLPGIALPFARLIRRSSTLTGGNELAGYLLIAGVALAFIAAAIRSWRWRNSTCGQDMLILLVAAAIPAIWVLLMPRHTYIHAPFMVRILVVPISLVPLALFWSPERSAIASRTTNHITANQLHSAQDAAIVSDILE